MEKKKLRISFNSPVVLMFVLICGVSLILSNLTAGYTNRLLFSVYQCSLKNPFAWVRFVGHIFGHANWEHFLGNMTYILLLGPLLEEKYGSTVMIELMALTAVVTGIIHFIFFPGVALLGASGVVFAMILLSSLTSMRDGMIPLTFILISVAYIGGQIYQGVFVLDNVSNLTHIVGGVVGSIAGFAVRKGEDTPKIENNY